MAEIKRQVMVSVNVIVEVEHACWTTYPQEYDHLRTHAQHIVESVLDEAVQDKNEFRCASVAGYNVTNNEPVLSDEEWDKFQASRDKQLKD